MKMSLIILLFVALAATFSGCRNTGPRPDQAFRRFYHTLIREPSVAPRLYKQLSSRSREVFDKRWRELQAQLPQGVTLAKRQLFVAAFSRLGNRIKTLKIKTRNETKCLLDVTFDRGAATVTMVREQGRWKIELFP